MSEFTDLLLSSMSPVNALLQVGLGAYIWFVKEELKEDVGQTRARVSRLESTYIPDGGETP